MSVFWLGVVSVHVLSAVAWVGGMIFLSLVFAPLVRTPETSADSRALFRSAALRFRAVVWTAMALLLTTGPLLLAQRHVGLANPGTWPPIVTVKLSLLALLFLSTFAHDLVLGPRVSQISAIPASVRTPWERMLMQSARWLPRFSLLLAAAVVVAGLALARS